MRRETPLAGPLVVKSFKEREIKALELIIESGIEFIKLGIFGSYARNEYKSTSDIDIIAIVKDHPPRRISGEIREDLEMIEVGLIYSSPDYFSNSQSLFAKCVCKDYIRRLVYGERIL